MKLRTCKPSTAKISAQQIGAVRCARCRRTCAKPVPASYCTAALMKAGIDMRVLVACEFSGIVREAFRRRGHDAWSCDLLPAEDGSPHHLQMDMRLLSLDAWDMLIAFPPCTYLAVSGARWFAKRKREQQEAIDFVEWLASRPVAKCAIENPIGVLSTKWCKPAQIVQPWMFGHGETKATCLWLNNLPLLKPTNIVAGRHARVHREPPSPERWRNRSRTYTGIAEAMAMQWGGTP